MFNGSMALKGQDVREHYSLHDFFLYRADVSFFNGKIFCGGYEFVSIALANIFVWYFGRICLTEGCFEGGTVVFA